MRDPQRVVLIGQDNTETYRRPLIRESQVIRNLIKRTRINELARGTVTAATVWGLSPFLSWGDLKEEIIDCVSLARELCSPQVRKFVRVQIEDNFI